MQSERWFVRLAVVFGAFNVVGALAALSSGLLWSTRISRRAMPPIGFLVQCAGLVVVGALALAAAVRVRHNGRTLWWLAVVLAVIEWVVGVWRGGAGLEDFAELAVLATIVVSSHLLLRSIGTSGGSLPTKS